MPTIEINDDYLLLLDGKVDAPTQRFIDEAKQRKQLASQLGELPQPLAELVSKAVAEAIKEGLLVWYYDNISWCSLCKKSGGYAKHKRSGRYHRKGDDDHKKPLTFRGVELAKRYVSIRNHISLGGCLDCVNAAGVHLREALKDVKAQLPAELCGPVRYKRWDNYRCKCGWEGHEDQLGNLLTLMGDGYYKGKCPSCGAENQLFSQPVERQKKFSIVEQQPATVNNERGG